MARMTVTTAPVRELGVHRELDGLRGIAILAVLATHVIFLDGGDDRWALRGGFLGVDVFLVLSGFLIGGVLVREAAASGTLDGAGFARRRVHRLVPPLLLLVVVQGAVALVIGSDAGEQLLQAVLALTFTSNWQLSFGHHAPFELVHLWSLSLEGQFYALAAVAVWAVRRRLGPGNGTGGGTSVLPLVVAIGLGALGAAAWRFVLTDRGFELGALYQRTDTRLDSLLFGIAAVLVWRHRLVSDAVLRLAGVAGLAVLAVSWVVAEPSSTWLFRGGFTVIAAAAAAVVAAAATGAGTVARIGDLAALRWIGGISFSLYLWHLPIYIWVRRGLPDVPLWLSVLIAVPGSFLAAVISFRLVESRAIARRRSVPQQPGPR
jgi:peptidoglycan/LPS O-acetylase OafA/YrhL